MSLPAASNIHLNARFKSRPVTGVERFAWEVGARLATHHLPDLGEIAPEQPVQGLKGHAWEQFQLPRQLPRGAALFSPCNTGPIAVTRQLVVIHDAAVWDCPDGFSTTFRHLYRQLLPRLARRSRAIATVSEFSRQRLAHWLQLPAERIAVLGNAVGPEFTPGDPAPPTDAKAGGPVLLCVGSLDPRKNLNRLLRAWLDLHAAGRLPDGARLHLVGGANPRSFAALDRVEDHDSIRWLGRLSDRDLIEQYRRADAFIFPSLYEGFGLPPLEAMACGCPVLLSHRASLPEVGGPAHDPAGPANGTSGAALYFDPESEADIARAIERFLSLAPDQRAALRTAALARAATFRWETVAARTAEVLERI